MAYTYPEKGQIIFVNRQIASQTGTIQMAAAFPNKDASLRPGGFGTGADRNRRDQGTRC